MPVKDLRRSPMMAHLMDALKRGEDIGHYGRLTFAMVAHHFVEPDELVRLLEQDKTMDTAQAKSLVQQMASRGYSPPRRERILEWQAQQEFPICPNSDDPDACNPYAELEMPEAVIEHIEEYREQQFDAQQGG
jgi:DNA primase large subunit